MNTRFHHPLRIAAAALAMAAAAQVAAAPITINSSNVVARASDGVGGSANDQHFGTAYGSTTLTAVDGGSSSTTLIDWSDTDTGAVFDFSFDHVRTGARFALAQTFENSLFFTADQDTTYSLSGVYSSEVANRVRSDAFLSDQTTGSLLFRDLSESRNTANELFMLGVAGDGDTSNFNVGTLTGNLVGGHQYRFFFNNFIETFPNTDNGAAATGCLRLSIGGATGKGECGAAPVDAPEPAPLALLGLGFTVLALRRLR